ncbi:MAG: hypothetical protein ABJE47_08815 [bacterium]
MSGSCGWFPLPYEEIVAWVERHASELPQTLAELSRYPTAFRRVIVNRVSPELRTLFWSDHVRTFLDADAALTAEQRAFLEGALGELPGIIGSPLVEGQARIRPIEERTRTLFTREQAAAMFGMVGPPEPPEGLPLPPGTRLTPIDHDSVP